MRRLLSGILALGVALAGLVLDPTAAYACSCASTSPRRALAAADTVFVGTVRAIDEVSGGQEADLRFETTRVFKGTAFQTQVVRSATNSAACGLTPELGTTWVIFAQEQVRGEGSQAVRRLATGLCEGNLPTGTAPALLGPGSAPQPGASDRTERATRADRQATRGLVVTGLVGVGVIALAGIGLAVLWGPGRSGRPGRRSS